MVSNQLTLQLLPCHGRAVAPDKTTRRRVVGQIRDAILFAWRDVSGRHEAVER
jgi:hypothetical protein